MNKLVILGSLDLLVLCKYYTDTVISSEQERSIIECSRRTCVGQTNRLTSDLLRAKVAYYAQFIILMITRSPPDPTFVSIARLAVEVYFLIIRHCVGAAVIPRPHNIRLIVAADKS